MKSKASRLTRAREGIYREARYGPIHLLETSFGRGSRRVYKGFGLLEGSQQGSRGPKPLEITLETLGFHPVEQIQTPKIDLFGRSGESLVGVARRVIG